MHFQNERGLLPMARASPSVVLLVAPTSRSFTPLISGFRRFEAAADLDQFAARDDDFWHPSQTTA
jgi:hypothetical protein